MPNVSALLFLNAAKAPSLILSFTNNSSNVYAVTRIIDEAAKLTPIIPTANDEIISMDPAVVMAESDQVRSTPLRYCYWS